MSGFYDTLDAIVAGQSTSKKKLHIKRSAKEELDRILATEPAIREMIIQDEMNELTENTLRHRKEEQERRIKEGEKRLEEGEKRIEKGKKELAEGKKELEENKKKLEDGEKRLEESKKELEKNKKELEKNKKELEEQQEKINNTIRKMKEKGLTIEEIKELTNLSEEEVNEIIKH